MELTIDDRTIRARQFASQIMAIIGDCVSDKDGASSMLIDAAYRADAKIISASEPKQDAVVITSNLIPDPNSASGFRVAQPKRS